MEKIKIIEQIKELALAQEGLELEQRINLYHHIKMTEMQKKWPERDIDKKINFSLHEFWMIVDEEIIPVNDEEILEILDLDYIRKL